MLEIQPVPDSLPTQIEEAIANVSPRDPQFASKFVGGLLQTARKTGVSDVHLNPCGDALEVKWRLDGVLQPLARLPKAVGPNIVARLKVLAGLLTYETALPQEGRIRDDGLSVEARVSTFPSLHGERAVLRLLGVSNQSLESLEQLGLPSSVVVELDAHLAATSGAILVVGPAGSGKTTTAYACLRRIVTQGGGGRSIASLEDPIEVAVESIAQSQVNLSVGFDMAAGLRGLLRLDPEVILVGEMRDRPTAEVAMQAALTGQLVITTFHAGNCDDAINRLIELGIPDYAVRNAVRLIVAQRLVRRLCSCATEGNVEEHARPFGMSVAKCWIPGECDDCHRTGYRGRALVAEWRATHGHADATPPAGDGQLWTSAAQLVEEGITSAEEAFRVLGLRRKTSEERANSTQNA